MSSSRRKVLIRAILLVVACGGAMFLFLRLAGNSWNAKYCEETREPAKNQQFMEEDTVLWQGKRYKKKPAMSLILLAGIDQEGTEQSPRTRYRNGGQADFLLLLAIDHQNQRIHQLQIDRDTMAQITILGVYGNETGTRQLQICLAHSFGARREDNARYLLRAVRGMMDEIEIDGYYTVNYSAVPVLADALDGVTVTIPEDMTSVNASWSEGTVVTLRGQDAETFVRTRKTVGSGTNAERMTRQAVFMRAALDRMNQRLGEGSDFASGLLSALRSVACTNLTDVQLLEEMNQSHGYAVQPIDYLPGEYVLPENGFIEFYPEEGSPTAWVMENLYREI